ncbi:tetratricopeptide repeat protein [Shewanella phaeophyticola]|uniref:Sel1 repeat family protein n=1 Tax=Shewanella phaeophyticola TaxID=2978345 RepID=A0ABT2P719_9GAMM|nr:hypothetical protein [Shewanella sp. KJ10-1]MCT8988455.1 hypothetical protein [Shewanella sp. KJ10-1]
MANLGEIYLNGEGVAVDRELGISWLTKAAERGQNDAQYLLGQGLITNQQQAAGEQWIKKSAEAGNKKAIQYLTEHQ